MGESLVYSAKLGFLRLGTGNIEVARIDTVRGIPAYYFRFELTGGNALYRLNSVLESWTRVDNLTSLRYQQDNNENGKVRQRRFEIFPDSGFYRQEGVKDSLPTVEHPLDDAAFLFFMRTQQLEVGREYRLDYYFRKDKNPVILRVEKEEEMEMPDGTKVSASWWRPSWAIAVSSPPGRKRGSGSPTTSAGFRCRSAPSIPSVPSCFAWKK